MIYRKARKDRRDTERSEEPASEKTQLKLCELSGLCGKKN